MSRAEMRRAKREELKEKTATYNLTKEQLNALVRKEIGDEIARIKTEATNEAVNTATLLMLTLPMKVLIDNDGQNSYETRMPQFIDQVLDYYAKWQNGELDVEKMREELWKYGGVKIVDKGV